MLGRASLQPALDLPGRPDSERPTSDYRFQYDLTRPDQSFYLPDELEEISGLSLSSDGRYLVAVQDEDGIIFMLDKRSGKIENKIEFWKEGDYEAVEMVGDEIFAAKSTGTLYRILRPGMPDQALIRYKFFLGKDNNVEGLAYDPLRHRLLMACKGEAGNGEHFQFKRGVYGFDLKSMELDTTPAYLISLEAVQDYLNTEPDIRKYDKLVERFNEEVSEFSFSPSAIAVHPNTGNIYLCSSPGKTILVLSPGGKVVHIEKMDKKIHAQPEGLCFDKDGTMFISNEGKEGRAVIHVFRMK
jgi:uncharacterized protein YjiK